MRPQRAVGQTGKAALAITLTPLRDGAHADPHGAGDVHRMLAAFKLCRTSHAFGFLQIEIGAAPVRADWTG